MNMGVKQPPEHSNQNVSIWTVTVTFCSSDSEVCLIHSDIKQHKRHLSVFNLQLQSEQVHLSKETTVVEIKAFKHMETRVYGSEGAEELKECNCPNTQGLACTFSLSLSLSPSLC